MRAEPVFENAAPAGAGPRGFAPRVAGFWRRAVGTSYFGSHVLLATATSLLMGALGFLSGPLAARLLGPTGRGELAAIQAWPLLLTTLAALGLHEALIYFSARTPDRSASYLTSATLIALVASIPAVAAGYLLMPLLLHAQTPATITTARWYLVVVPLASLIAMPMGALRGRRDLVTWNALRLATPVGWLLLLLAAWWTGHRTAGWLAAAFLGLSAALACLAWSVAWGRIRGARQADRDDWPALLRYGVPTMASQTPMLLNMRFDQMLMAAFLAPGMLGLYAVAVAWSAAIGPVLSGVGSVVFPVVASHREAADRLSVLARGTRLAVVLAVACGVVLGLFAPVAIPALFGSAFEPAVPAALVLVLAAVVAEIAGVLREGARGLGATGAVLKSELCGLFVGLGTLALLIGPLGILGAALASLIGYSAGAAWLARAVRQETGCSTAVLLRPRMADVRSVVTGIRGIARVRRHDT